MNYLYIYHTLPPGVLYMSLYEIIKTILEDEKLSKKLLDSSKKQDLYRFLCQNKYEKSYEEFCKEFAKLYSDSQNTDKLSDSELEDISGGTGNFKNELLSILASFVVIGSSVQNSFATGPSAASIKSSTNGCDSTYDPNSGILEIKLDDNGEFKNLSDVINQDSKVQTRGLKIYSKDKLNLSDGCFNDFSALEFVSISASNITIHDNVFKNLEKLKVVEIDCSNYYINTDELESCPNLVSTYVFKNGEVDIIISKLKLEELNKFTKDIPFFTPEQRTLVENHINQKLKQAKENTQKQDLYRPYIEKTKAMYKKSMERSISDEELNTLIEKAINEEKDVKPKQIEPYTSRINIDYVNTQMKNNQKCCITAKQVIRAMKDKNYHYDPSRLEAKEKGLFDTIMTDNPISWVLSAGINHIFDKEDSYRFGHLKLVHNLSKKLLEDICRHYAISKKDLVSIEFPPEVTYFPPGCFDGCTNLIDIKINASKVLLTRESFKGADKLQSLRFSKYTKFVLVLSQEAGTIRDNSDNSLVIRSDTTQEAYENPDKYTFGVQGRVYAHSSYSCKDNQPLISVLEDCTSPDSCTIYHKDLDKIHVYHANCNHITKKTLDNRPKLKSITFDDSITELILDDECFSNCIYLEEIQLPKNLTKITVGQNCFKGCLHSYELERFISDVQKNISDKNKAIEKAKIQTDANRLKHIENQIELIRQEEDKRKRTAEIDKANNLIEQAKIDITNYEKESLKIEGSIQTYKKQINDKRLDIEKHKSEKPDLSNKSVELQDMLLKLHNADIKIKEAELDKLEAQLEVCTTKLSSVNNSINNKREFITIADEYIEHLKNEGKIDDRLADAIKKENESDMKLEEANRKLKQAEETLRIVRMERDELSKKEQELNQRENQIKIEKKQIEHTKEELETRKKELDERQEKINSQETLFGRVKRNFAEISDSVSNLSPIKNIKKGAKIGTGILGILLTSLLISPVAKAVKSVKDIFTSNNKPKNH